MYLPWQAVSAGGSYQRFWTDPNLKRAFKHVAALLLRRPRAYWNHPQTGERLLSKAVRLTSKLRLRCVTMRHCARIRRAFQCNILSAIQLQSYQQK